jgi:hypothetical protein
VDAFNSDVIPVHLLTREALELYLQKLSDHDVGNTVSAPIGVRRLLK